MFKVKNKVAYFGLEYDHNKVPNAIVIASARPQKVIKWVNAYKPVVIEQEDGTKVRRERTAVQCPPGFRLRKDEIRAAMKRNKTESWQDGKFFVILDHRMGQWKMRNGNSSLLTKSMPKLPPLPQVKFKTAIHPNRLELERLIQILWPYKVVPALILNLLKALPSQELKLLTDAVEQALKTAKSKSYEAGRSTTW
jgi:hypothetical protein